MHFHPSGQKAWRRWAVAALVDAAAVAVEADGDSVAAVAVAVASANGSEAAGIAGQSVECALPYCWDGTAVPNRKEGSSSWVHQRAWLGQSVLSDAGSHLSAHCSGLTNNNGYILSYCFHFLASKSKKKQPRQVLFFIFFYE